MNIKLSFAVFLASLTTILIADQFVFRLMGIQSFADLEKRYKVNGVASAMPGFFKNSDELPYENKKNIDIYFEDSHAYPRALRIINDNAGFRNPPGFLEGSKIAIIGDSVVFGYASQKGETLSDVLSNKLQTKVYNISAGGWGPAEYMKAFDSHELVNDFNEIYLVFSLPNDDANLYNSCWLGDDGFLPPKSGKLTRSDIGQKIYAPPIFVITSPLRYSRIALMLYALWEGLPVGVVSPEKKTALQKAKALSTAVSSLEVLKTGECVAPSHTARISNIQQLLKSEKFVEADKHSYDLSRDLIAEGCYPLVEATSFGRPIKRKMNYNFVARYNVARLSYASTDIFDNNSRCKYPSSKQKDEAFAKKQKIFAEWVINLSKKKSVKVFLFPGEYQLAELQGDKTHWLCQAVEPNASCADLTGAFQTEYLTATRSLYADGVHLNFAGTLFIADLMAQGK